MSLSNLGGHPRIGHVDLSPRERQVSPLITNGLSDPAIAEELQLSTRTIDAHAANVSAKIGTSNRTELPR